MVDEPTLDTSQSRVRRTPNTSFGSRTDSRPGQGQNDAERREDLARIDALLSELDVLIGEVTESQRAVMDVASQMQEAVAKYLQLQSQMQHENRNFTRISNILKTKHETVKNSINNIR
jgi:hypothetical protein